ncbi:MAG: LytR/AlgR family response regulator transcription factor [Sphingomonadaceae bacterium]
MSDAENREAPLRVLIVDDEPLAVERLQMLLDRCEDAALAGTAQDGEAALRMAEQVGPDLLLLDISMPGLDGIDVARALARGEADPAVVFVTAFDNFAVSAFDVAAVDYLLKPVAQERLERALERARGHRRSATQVPKRSNDSAYVSHFWVPDRNELVRVAAEDIDRITAERDYMRLHVGRKSWLIHRTISKLEEELDPARFIRLHRSAIVRRDFIEALVHQRKGGWTARLADGSEQSVGRSYVAGAKAIAGR